MSSPLLQSQRKAAQQKGLKALASLGGGGILWLLLPGWVGWILLFAGLVGAGKWGWDWWQIRSQWGLRL